MFFKKKTKNTEATFQLDFELDRRCYYRVVPSPREPLFFEVGDKRFLVLDISAGGLAVADSGFRHGARVAGKLFLPGLGRGIPLIMTILETRGTHEAGGQFEKIREEDREQIHRYVLRRQKEEIDEEKLAARKRRNNESAQEI